MLPGKGAVVASKVESTDLARVIAVSLVTRKNMVQGFVATILRTTKRLDTNVSGTTGTNERWQKSLLIGNRQ